MVVFNLLASWITFGRKLIIYRVLRLSFILVNVLLMGVIGIRWAISEYLMGVVGGLFVVVLLFWLDINIADGDCGMSSGLRSSRVVVGGVGGCERVTLVGRQVPAGGATGVPF